MWVCRLPVHIGPLRSYAFAADSRKNGAFCRVDVGIDPYNTYADNIRNSELLQISRERSKKTEAVFLVALRGLRGEIEIPPGSFSFASVFFWRSKRKCCAAPANFD